MSWPPFSRHPPASTSPVQGWEAHHTLPDIDCYMCSGGQTQILTPASEHFAHGAINFEFQINNQNFFEPKYAPKYYLKHIYTDGPS